MTDIVLVYVTVPDHDQAKTIARCVVEEGLAACANVLPSVLAYAAWEGSVEEVQESVLILKTTQHAYARLESRIRGLHSYDCPCILSVQVAQGAADFINWIRRSVVPA